MSGAAILLGTAADGVLGDPRRGHPVALFGRLAGGLESVAWRPTRRAGAVHTALLVGVAALAGRLLERAAGDAVQRAVRGRGERASVVVVGDARGRRSAARLGRTVARAALVWTALGGRSLAREAAAVDALVAGGDLDGARRRIRSLVGRDPDALDATELRRAVVESLGENVADAVVASHLWTAAGGGAGVCGHRAANTLDAMVGNRSPRHARFGTPAARLDDVLNWPAARLTGALAVALAPAVGGSPRAAARAWRRDAPAHPSPNAGVAEAAFAGALGLRLGGTLSYAGRVEHRPVLHAAGRDPGPGDVARAIRLARLVGLASAAVCAAAGRRA